MTSQNNSAFTLVELIVVIVILSILATISFLSFSSYSSSSRDSVRLSDITSIAKGLTLQYSIGGSYIIPDNSVSLLSGSTTIIGYQGKAGYNTLNSIKLSTSNNNSGKDPLDNTYYTYNINSNKNKYQLSGFLENKGNIINRTSSINNREGNNDLIPHLTPAYRQAGPSRLGEELSSLPLTKGELEGVFQINQTYATTYANRYPYTKGDSIGVILNYTGTTTGNTTTNTIYTPIEDNISTSTGIDISSGTLTSGKIVINNNTDSSTGVSVVSMSGYVSSNGSCILPPLWYGINIGNPAQLNVPYQSTDSSAACYMTGCINGHTGASCNQIDSNTVLLLHGDGINNSTTFVDSGFIPKTITSYGNAKISIAQNKFSGSSMYFDGVANTYASIPSSTDWNFGTGDFTIDLWINPSITHNDNDIIDFGPTITTDARIMFWTNNSFYYFINGDGNCTVGDTLGTPIGQWTHYAIVRNGTNIYLYKNGNLSVKHTNCTTSISYNSSIVMGRRFDTGTYFNGYIDEFRISKGIARRTSNFIPPNIPY